ncbi:PGPGW domain-containing protein [Streptomyces sp. JJ36]|uniref:PGPGW domain-containing protein n=1 Tax=Streptomyces sp. JJ36 TaxID=2736645 RepID=UPI001F3521AB|nr:PGPGW domain-containing protein [Streptomyces sp. JJ36]MCF6522838.1 hypothetical protein [Streptomyces sp. JJ36]
MTPVRHVRRVFAVTLGGVLLLVGTLLLVLPGPGLLLVLAGLIVLAREFPAVDRFIAPVRTRAMQAAAESVSSRWRIAASACVALCLVAAGIACGLVDRLPVGGWSTGSGLILSGLILAGLLWWSHRRTHGHGRASLPSGTDSGS